MKRTYLKRILCTLCMLLLCASYTHTYAVVAPETTPVKQPQSSITPPTLSLSERKEKAVIDLTATLTKLTTITQKVGVLAIARTTPTDAVTQPFKSAQASLLAATNALADLTKAHVTGETLPEDVDPATVLTEAMTKEQVLKIETNLIATRSALIDTLTALKASLIIASQ